MKRPSLKDLLAEPEEDGEEDEDMEVHDDEYTAEATAAFPEFEGKPERIAALKRFVKLCME